MKKILNEFNADRIDTLELSRRISSVRPIYAARPKDLEELRKIYIKRWQKDWRKPSPVLRDAMREAIAFIHKENRRREEETRGLVEAKLLNAIDEVHEHLKLFGIVKETRTLTNLWYR